MRVYLIGNKAELEDEREITFERALEFAKTHNIHKVFETSAKTGFNVEDVFACVGKELFIQVVKEQEEQNRLALETPTPGAGKGAAKNMKLKPTNNN